MTKKTLSPARCPIAAGQWGLTERGLVRCVLRGYQAGGGGGEVNDGDPGGGEEDCSATREEKAGP